MTSRVEAVRVLRPDSAMRADRVVAVEAPVAVEVNGLGYAVMMMTPADLPAFATGFLLTERLIDAPADLIDLDLFGAEAGWIVRATVSARCAERVHDRVRHRASDASCGLCGIAGLEQLRRPLPAQPPRSTVAPEAIFAALAALRERQPLNALTGAVHAAAACDDAGAITAVFEDVGRHNALDKLIGALALKAESASDLFSSPAKAGAQPLPLQVGPGVRQGRTAEAIVIPPAPAFFLVTSRISFELVDKALVARAPLLVGVSAATSLAIDHARAHDLTLIALARADAMLVMNDPHGLFREV